MSATDNKITPLSLLELTELLVKHYGLTEGKFDLLVNFQVGAGAFGPTLGQQGPGIAVSLAQVGLSPAANPGAATVDAAKLTPKRRIKRP